MSKYKIIVKVRPWPKAHEYSAAQLVADFLKSNVEFVQTGGAKTPDLLIGNQLWEIKSPTGAGTRTIMHQFQRAAKQSSYMIFDARRIKMEPEKCVRRVRLEFRGSKMIKRVIFIGKDAVVREIRK